MLTRLIDVHHYYSTRLGRALKRYVLPTLGFELIVEKDGSIFIFDNNHFPVVELSKREDGFDVCTSFRDISHDSTRYSW